MLDLWGLEVMQRNRVIKAKVLRPASSVKRLKGVRYETLDFKSIASRAPAMCELPDRDGNV